MDSTEGLLKSVGAWDLRDDFEELYLKYLEYNSIVNISSITDRTEFYIKHIADSLYLAGYFNGKCLDIGCGAGFPGIPLAMLNRSLYFTELDSVNKKLDFIRLVKEQFGLDNIEIIHCRIEDFNVYGYDTVTARALAPLNVLCEYALPFLQLGGSFVAYKSSDTDEEIKQSANALKILGGEITALTDYVLPYTDIKRRAVIIKKIKNSPQGYPRKGNKPRIKPL